MAYNALAAALVGIRLGLSASQIQRGIAGFTPSGNRMDDFDSPWGVAVMNDSYNANPESMVAALDVLAARSGLKACILGDMKELGEFTEQEHCKLGRYAVEKSIDTIIFVGEASLDAYHTARGLRSDAVYHFMHKDALAPYLRGILKSGCSVLIKGSRSMKLDELADLLRH
jgi:UDP-N-acetylmuramoyl-tripeptide--D-alanyl-D-alanine ligase